MIQIQECEVLKDQNLFMESIKNGNQTKVKQIIDKHTNCKILWSDDKDQSAAFVALSHGNIDVYEVLISSGFSLAPHENIEDTGVATAIHVNRKLREIHTQNVKHLLPQHLQTLISSSRLSHETSDNKYRLYCEHVLKAFVELNDIEWVKLVLEVVAYGKHLEIMFDLNVDSTHRMDPTTRKFCEGICYPSRGHIYIGGRNLLGEEGADRHVALGVLIHELSHYAMKLVYNNGCKPYKQGDGESENKFKQILTACEVNKAEDGTISSVFDLYPENVHQAELIVRAPQIIVLYQENPEKLKELKSTFVELFSYFETKTVCDLRREIPLLEARTAVENVNEANEVLSELQKSEISFKAKKDCLPNFDTKSFKGVLAIKTSSSRLTMIAIHQQFGCDSDFSSSFVFVTYGKLLKPEIFKMVEKAANVCSKPITVINCGKRKREEITSLRLKLSQSNMENRIIIVFECNFDSTSGLNMHMNHKWSELSSETQERLLEKFLTFQGTRVRLKSLQTYFELLESLDLESLIEETIEIGGLLLSNCDKTHVERRFLTEMSNREWYLRNPSKQMTVNDLIDFAEDQKVILLSDEPGMGKSTEFRFLTKVIKDKFPLRWIELIDLKVYVHAFEKDGKVTRKFDSNEEITGYFCEKILQLKPAERELFKCMFNNDKVVFLFDGFDEISPSFKEFNLKLLKATRRLTKNRIWVSTRPHLVQDLKQDLGETIAIKLQQFSKTDRSDFLKQKLLKTMPDENIEAFVEQILTFMDVLEQSIEGSVFNPLLLEMISEVFKDSDSVDNVCQSLFTIYDAYTKKLLGKVSEKGCEAIKDLADFAFSSDLIQTHQKLAFECIFYELNARTQERIAECFKDAKPVAIKKIARMGLIYVDVFGKVQFTHRTFAEFFIAKYFYDALMSSKNQQPSSAIVNLFDLLWDDQLYDYDSLTSNDLGSKPRHKVIKMFLDSAFDCLIRESIMGEETVEIRMIRGILLNMFTSEKVLPFVSQVIADGLINIYQILIKIETKSENRPTHFWIIGSRENATVLMIAARHQSEVSSVKKFFNLALDELGPNTLKELLSRTDTKRRNIFHYLARNKNPKVVSFSLHRLLVPFTDQEKCELLFSRSYRGVRFFYSLLANIILKNSEEIALINSPDRSGRSVNDSIMISCKNNIYDTGGIYEARLRYFGLLYSESDVELFWSCLPKKFNFDWIKSFLTTKNVRNLTPFHIATWNKDEKAFKKVLDIYRETFTKKEMRKIINDKNSKLSCILIYAIQAHDNSATLEVVWDYMQFLFTVKTLKKILLNKSKEGLNIFHESNSIFQYETKKKIFKRFIDKNFTSEEKKIYF